MNVCKSKESKFGPIALIFGSCVAMFTGIFNFSMDDNNWFNQGDNNFPDQASFIDRKSRTNLADLRGDWRFAIGDGIERAQPDFDDSSWSTIDVPSSWESEGYRGYDGFAWYRRSFSIEIQDTSKPLFIGLGRIDDADEVYVNGQKVGSSGAFPPNAVTAWNKDRLYRLPSNLVRSDRDNVIAVRVFDSTMDGGIKNGAIGIYTTDLPQPLIDLSGKWNFATGDDAMRSSESFDESDFKTVNVPARWEDEGYPNYDGYAWYRKTFELQSPAGVETMILMLGTIDDTDEAFLNGTRIGGNGVLNYSDRETNSDFYREQRNYPFPSSLLKQSNTLAVRVHDSGGDGGIYQGPIGIMTAEDHDEYWRMLKENRKWNLDSTVDWLMGKN